MKNIPVAHHFRSKQETRKYLNNASKVLGIKEWKDWGNVSTRKFVSIGGQSVITEHGSIFQALQFAYPGTKHSTAIHIGRGGMESELVSFGSWVLEET